MSYSTKMQAASFRWLLNIILAGLIYANAEAGRLLGIQSLPLHFSPVWPATGFSLTALLLFGFKAWPGIFVGNFVYNLVHLSAAPSYFGPSISALAITLGSLIQALVGGYIMHTYSSRGYFTTVKDVVIFLLCGGLITCIIAPTIGVLSFYLEGILPAQNVAFTWLTFWSGDVMGVFVCTPLLVVWSLGKSAISWSEKQREIVAMLAGFILLGFLFYTVHVYPPIYLFIPFCLWVGYRLGFHGATIAILLIAITTILMTTLGQGWFIYRFYDSALLSLVMFLETLVLTALFAAGCHPTTKPKA